MIDSKDFQKIRFIKKKGNDEYYFLAPNGKTWIEITTYGFSRVYVIKKFGPFIVSRTNITSGLENAAIHLKIKEAKELLAKREEEKATREFYK